MSDRDKIALVYWPDTTGHAARSVPLAKEIDRRGHDLILAGGGFGETFFEMNGFELKDTTDFEIFPESDSTFRLVTHTLTDTVPRMARRFSEFFSWFREEEPDTVVTDDMMCLLAASVLRIDYYRIENWQPSMFSFPISFLYTVYDKFTLLTGGEIVLTSLWPEEDAPKGYHRVGPLAQEGEGEVEEYDVLLMPGSFGEEFGEIREDLEQEGYDTEMVGADDWETKAVMTPHTEAASCVLCTGFSSIADATVGGTHCIVYPHLFLQRGLTRGIEERDLKGLEVVRSSDEARERIQNCLENKCETPEYENGVKEFVDIVEQG